MDAVVLYGRDAGHLYRGLESTSEEEATEASPILEKLRIRLCFVLTVKRDLLLDLLKFGLYPGILLVAMSVQFSEIAKTLLDSAVIDEPAWRLRKEKNESGKEDGGNDLDPQRCSPLPVVGRGKSNVRSCRSSVIVGAEKMTL